MIVCIKSNKSSLLQIDALREIARDKALTRKEGNSAFLCADMPFWIAHVRILNNFVAP